MSRSGVVSPAADLCSIVFSQKIRLRTCVEDTVNGLHVRKGQEDSYGDLVFLLCEQYDAVGIVERVHHCIQFLRNAWNTDVCVAWKILVFHVLFN